MKNLEILFLSQLLHAKGLGRLQIASLIDQYGSAQGVIEQGFEREKGLLFKRWKIDSWWEKDFEEAEKLGVKMVGYRDPTYPKPLLNISDFPLILYIKGSLPENNPYIALIGTRNATLYGKQTAEKFGRELAEKGVCVVSGLARGIDTAAHQGALETQGTTIAVIGSGLSHIYPQENVSLAQKISQAGALISEYPMKTPPAKGLFPRRNRIISGISEVICLIESPKKGGGMLTMELAIKQGRSLFAVPGRVDWPTFEGNHAMIQSHKAQLAIKSEDLLKDINIPNNQLIKKIKVSSLSQQEQLILNLMEGAEKSIEELVLLTQLPIMQLNVFLTRLILKKLVKEFPGKIYKIW